LSPNAIISFKGRHNVVLRSNGHYIIEISDPSFILQGGGGHFRESGNYYQAAIKVNDEVAIGLAKNYSENCCGRYQERKKLEAVRIYLLKYYHDWIAA
jgi:hypothetical protein